MVALPSASASTTTSRIGWALSRHAMRSPMTTASMASGHAAQRGIAEASTAIGTNTDNASIAPISQRDGRSSNRQGTDAFDHGMQFGVF